MSKTYWRGNSNHEYKRLAFRRDEEDWKSEVAEEMAEEEMQEVFIIENEWSSLHGPTGHENVSVYLTLQDAEEALWIRAQEFGVELSEGDHSFNLHDSDKDDSDIYYIGIYTVGDRG